MSELTANFLARAVLASTISIATASPRVSTTSAVVATAIPVRLVLVLGEVVTSRCRYESKLSFDALAKRDLPQVNWAEQTLDSQSSGDKHLLFAAHFLVQT